jgi:DNA-directed RNA polymerase specialized sigma24 family protein
MEVEQEVTEMFEPFAVEVYRRYLNGETVEQLAANLEIPCERIEMRIQAAAQFLKHSYRHAA